jgi:RNA polymerase sigma-70 factor, ECF subfamily
MGSENSPQHDQRTDQRLVEDVRGGDRKAYSELVKRHQKGLLRLSMRFMKDIDQAKDIVQDAFIKAYEKIDLFEGRSTFKSWLFQIAVNGAKNKLRENRYHFTDIDEIEIGTLATAESHLVHVSVGEQLQKEVDLLPFKQKTALVLRVYEDMSFAEIAEIMDCPYDTAKANYRHGLLKLKEVFEKKSELKTWATDKENSQNEIKLKFVEAE